MTPSRMTGLRLIADDLTGALDSAARLVSVHGPIPTFLSVVPDNPPTAFAIDANTRAAEADIARASAIFLAPALAVGDPAYRKLDSLLRGHAAIEIAATAKLFQHVIVAPAFPYQGRITRAGRQYSRTDNADWRDTGVDLAAELSALGIKTTGCVPGQPVPRGVSLWDAVNDTDLDQIVAAGRAVSGTVLWCGSGGLAGALAGRRPVPLPILPRPFLALVGSDQPTTKAQLAVLGTRHRVLDDPAEANAIAGVLDAQGGLALTVALPPALPRPLAARRINAVFAGLMEEFRRLRFPIGTLMVTGGATLRALVERLGVQRLDVDGELLPGVPTAILRGGPWEGQRLVAKSGAFGDAGLLQRLIG